MQALQHDADALSTKAIELGGLERHEVLAGNAHAARNRLKYAGEYVQQRGLAAS